MSKLDYWLISLLFSIVVWMGALYLGGLVP